MSWQTILTDAGVAVAVIGLIGLLAKALIDFHASRPAVEKIKVETFSDVAEQLDRLEEKVIKLRADNDKLREEIDRLHGRVEALEQQLREKENELVAEQGNIEILKQQFDELKTFVRGLLAELDTKGVEYTKPPAHLLETNPRIQAINKKAGA